MILVPFAQEGDPPFSEEDVLALGKNLAKVLGYFWDSSRVSPFIGKVSGEAVGVRVKPFGAATYAMTVLRCLKQQDCLSASEL